jgi:uncharacterized membrane protein
MSTNPYAAPKAQVADETFVPGGNFVPNGRTVPTGNGWTWFSAAWSIFRAAAGTWIAMVLVLLVVFIVLAILPIIGPIASMVLGPVFTGGLVMASRTAAEGGNVEFSQLFAGFKHRFGSLLAVGALYFAGMVAIILLTTIVSGVGMFGVLGGATSPEQVARMGFTIVLAMLIMAGLMLPLVMAIWFAPPLIVFHDMGAGEAMKASFLGGLKNMLPFLLYGIVLMVAAVLASIPLMLGWLVLGPVMAASVYTAYRDIYFSAA